MPAAPAPPWTRWGRPGPPKERLRVQKFPGYKIQPTTPLKRRDYLANSGFSVGHGLKYRENCPQHPVATVQGPSRLPLPAAPACVGVLAPGSARAGGLSLHLTPRATLPGDVSVGAAWRSWQTKLSGAPGPGGGPQRTCGSPPCAESGGTPHSLRQSFPPKKARRIPTGTPACGGRCLPLRPFPRPAPWAVLSGAQHLPSPCSVAPKPVSPCA